MPSIRTFGPWSVHIVQGLQPGKYANYMWKVEPQPSAFTYQITAHPQTFGTAAMWVSDHSVQWRRWHGGDIEYSDLTLYATFGNSGAIPIYNFFVIISLIVP